MLLYLQIFLSYIPCQIQLQAGFSFLMLSLHTWTVSLCPFWAAQCCLHLLYALFLHLNIVRGSWFIREGHLLPLLDFLQVGMKCWRWLENQPIFLDTLFFFFPTDCITLDSSSRHLKWLKSVLIKTRDMILLFVLFRPLRILNSIISRSLQPRLLPTFTSWISCCTNQSHQGALSLLAPWSPVRKLLSLHSTNILYCQCSTVVLSFQQI